MNIFENFKSKNIDELAEWFDKHINDDSAPWLKWWDENYCHKCEAEVVNEYSDLFGNFVEMNYAWCEVNHKCKYFKDMNDIPSIKEIIKMWLMNEVNKDDECEYGALA